MQSHKKDNIIMFYFKTLTGEVLSFPKSDVEKMKDIDELKLSIQHKLKACPELNENTVLNIQFLAAGKMIKNINDLFSISQNENLGTDENDPFHVVIRRKKKVSIKSSDTTLTSKNDLLHHGITQGNQEEIKRAISAGADVNSYRNNRTALDQLIQKMVWSKVFSDEQAFIIARYLLDNGASVSMRGADPFFRNTPILEAIAAQKPDLAQLFVDHAIKNDQLALDLADQEKDCLNTPLMLAIKTGWDKLALDIISQLPDAKNSDDKSGINHRAAHQFTPLHYACLLHQDSVIKELIKKGADIHAKNTFGATPLDYYLHEFNKIDIIYPYRPHPTNAALVCFYPASKLPILLCRLKRMPDLRHAADHPGFSNMLKVKPPVDSDLVILLGGAKGQRKPSVEFCQRMEAIYRKFLSYEKQTFSNGSYYQLSKKEFDEFFSLYAEEKKEEKSSAYSLGSMAYSLGSMVYTLFTHCKAARNTKLESKQVTSKEMKLSL